MAEKDYANCIEIVEAVMEWMAMRWTKSMMKRELREWFPNLSARTCEFIFSAARKEIIKRFNIDPKEYKGRQLALYENIIRTAKVREKLHAAERIDKLLGLEHLNLEDADATATKIREAIKEAKNKVVGVPEDVRKRSGDEGQSNTNAKPCIPDGIRNEQSTKKEKIQHTETVPDAIEKENIPSEVLEELNNLKAEEMNGFIKKKKPKKVNDECSPQDGRN